jgi:S1-C subfamily serine protease
MKRISCYSFAAFLLAVGADASRTMKASRTMEVSASPDFDHLRQSVIRIQAVSGTFDWFKPFVKGEDQVGFGSGFVVQTEPYPLFVTNEHVINNAKLVALQLLLFGEQQWEAEVVSVCSKFDLALLVLKNPKEFTDTMKSKGIELKALKIASDVPSMGEDVVAMGFPLGQDALKISKGNFAGNEEVDGNICLQSTAPISPGSSGGPLLDGTGEEVVGVNFAKATEGENINYVIPAWRVTQLIQNHLHEQPKVPEDGKWKRLQVQVPNPELTTIEANAGLYALSKGCKAGVFISKISDRSFFRNAEPPVPDQSFLVSANDVELDQFGMGLNSKYAADKVMYTDLFFMQESLYEPVHFETCKNGTVIKHKASRAWNPRYERGLRYVNEPGFTDIEYEMFGDVSIMEMTINHIATVIQHDPGPARWLHPDLISQPRLMINFVRPGSYAADFLSPGSAIAKVNGHEVHTLAELREHFVPEGGKDSVWTLETDMGKMYATMYESTLLEQVNEAQQSNAPYLLTTAVVSAANKMQLVNGTALGALGTPAFASKKSTKKQASLLTRMEPYLNSFKFGPGDSLEPRAAGPLIAMRSYDGKVRAASSALPLI